MQVTKEVAKYKGKLTLRHFDANGKLINEFTKDNLIVDTGLAYFAGRNAGNAMPAIGFMGIGSDINPPDIAETTLGAELGRVVTANSNTSTDVPEDTAVFIAVFGAGVATGALVEAGLFNAGSGGLMVSRIVFDLINKGPNDSVSATWAIQSK